jgi:serine/threonine protein kinase
VHRAKKKTGTDLADVAIFMYDKKNAKVTKQLTAAQQLEIFEILKRDATGLAKFRHPNMLNLIEAPIEDKTIIAYVTEPFEFNLASIAADPSKKELIPSELDLKCILLELIEIVNFLHANTKSIHLNLAPEHVYITKDGKMKLAGLNFIKNFTSADAVPAQLDSLLRVGDVSLVPNLRFAAPEVSSQAGMVSAQADIFSIGCLIYYMV